MRTMMPSMPVRDLVSSLRSYRGVIGAPWFTAAWDLNLFVMRSNFVGQWDDLVIAATCDDAGRDVVLCCTATGDAWGGEWESPTNAAGCIWTVDQHVKGGLTLGEHKGRPALRQAAPFRYVRWPAGAGHIPTVADLELLPAFTANVGTHIHNRASDKTPLEPATDDSEGCVVNLYQHEHAALIRLVEQQKARHGTATVSPTFCKRSMVKP